MRILRTRVFMMSVLKPASSRMIFAPFPAWNSRQNHSLNSITELRAEIVALTLHDCGYCAIIVIYSAEAVYCSGQSGACFCIII